METKNNLSLAYKMTALKKELSAIKMPKSGENKYAGFKYHELQDFLPFISILNEKYGVSESISMNREQVTITLRNVDEPEDFEPITFPFVEAEMKAKGGAPSQVDAIQRMGASITYNRRYAYLLAYGITENDTVDAIGKLEENNMEVLTNEILNKKKEDFENGKLTREEFRAQMLKFKRTSEQNNMIKEILNQA